MTANIIRLLTNVGLDDAMKAYKEMRAGVKPPGMWKTLLGVLSPLSGNTVTCTHCSLTKLKNLSFIQIAMYRD